MADSLPFTRSAAATRKGTTHPINEDAWRILDATTPIVKQTRRGVLYAVADGVSSTQQGQYAAQMTCNRLEGFFTAEEPPEAATLQQILLGIDAELAGGGRGKAACTLTSMWIFDYKAMAFHVGNSECLRVRGREIVSITPVPGKGSRRQLKEFVGMGKLEKYLIFGEADVEIGDVLLLFTDGVREAIEENQVLADLWLQSANDPEAFVASVIRICEEKQVEDDATIIAVHMLGMETIRLSVVKRAAPAAR